MKNIDIKLVEYLHNSRGEYLSGEELSKKLGVSRTAIWKHIKKLREKGYRIDSVTNKGYSLKGIPDRITLEEIKIILDTEEMGKELLVYDSLASTNEKAKELARQGYESGTIVIAEEQTAGKGRLGRQWYSPAETGLWLSIILRPDLLPIKSPYLTIIASLAVYQALENIIDSIGDAGGILVQHEDLDKGLRIKWPNDILLNGKKVCGILSEMSAEMDHIKYAVVGIGININQNSFPEEIINIATSLRIEYQKSFRRVKLLKLLLTYFENYYYLLLQAKDKGILETWKEKLSIIGQEITIYSNKQSFSGMVLNISEQGELILKTDDNTIKRFWAGDVSLRKIK
ncbi:MAG: biotin--[acetyl-CoA-carboxylase] ligase [Halanaerobiales bacterium]